MKVAIVIPAYNEEQRLGRTLQAYHDYLNAKQLAGELTYEIIVVANGCTDGTVAIAQGMQHKYGHAHMHVLNLLHGGKGLAIKAGFLDALRRDNDVIGFVDADMATKPEYFFALLQALDDVDGVIASRYMPGSVVTPTRPWIKRWGSRLVYEGLARLLLGISYHDMQCGAKVFKRNVIQAIAAHLSEPQFAIDAEMLYLCRQHDFILKELPTVWEDQAGSKLNMWRSGMRMVSALVILRLWHSSWRKVFWGKKEKQR